MKLDNPRQRVRGRDWALLSLGLLCVVVLTALGNWQIDRLAQKRALIAAVEKRAFGQPVPAPIGRVDLDDADYLRVHATGLLRHDLAVRVKALTDFGAGHWLMVPLQTPSTHIWINRGFIPARSEPPKWHMPEGRIRINGVLRVSEPDGTLLESNDPANGRWYSRDVAALSNNVGLSQAAAFFIDAAHHGPEETWPRGGLTKLQFRNSHLSYAATWYAMALLLFGALVYAVYDFRLNRLDR